MWRLSEFGTIDSLLAVSASKSCSAACKVPKYCAWRIKTVISAIANQFLVDRAHMTSEQLLFEEPTEKWVELICVGREVLSERERLCEGITDDF